MTKVLHLNNSAYERCSSCGGHGHYFDDLKGGPDWCRECGSNGYVRARDKQGRFLGTVDPLVNECVGEVLAAELSDILPKWAEQDRLSQFPEDMQTRVRESL